MIVIGIDLAAQAQKTAVCVLQLHQEHEKQLRVAMLEPCFEDSQLLDLMTQPGVTKIGIDAPFGWPLEFTRALDGYRESGVWPDPPGSDAQQSLMRLRSTDRLVADLVGVTPLSVSTDKLAVVAMRCARLLSALWAENGESSDRSGAGTAVEVYPTAAMRLWELSQHNHPQDPGGYKGPSAGAVRRRGRIINAVAAATHGWLELKPEQLAQCITSDHVLDALICALVALAVERGQVGPIGDHASAASEGWIALPDAPLAHLSGEPTDAGAPCSDSPVTFVPDGGYMDLYLPERFSLEIQDRVGGPWMLWAGGLERDWFDRGVDGSYVCTAHGGSPIYFRALSIDDRGVFEHVDGGGSGHVYRYRLQPEPLPVAR